MTIAAGLICSDGILVCADTEQSIGDFRFQNAKIFPFKDFLIVTGAGWTDYIRMAFDKICDEFKAGGPVNPSDARDIIEKVVLGIHREHNLFNLHAANHPSPPELHLLVAAKCGNGEFALIKSSGTATSLARDCEAIGSGIPLFFYWAGYFLSEPISMDAATYILLFILREIKNSSYGCGGTTHILRMAFDSKTPWISSYYDEREVLAKFPRSVAEILVACLELSSSDDELRRKLQEFQIKIENMRDSLKRQSTLHALHSEQIGIGLVADTSDPT